jgi:hypothetical protein
MKQWVFSWALLALMAVGCSPPPTPPVQSDTPDATETPGPSVDAPAIAEPAESAESAEPLPIPDATSDRLISDAGIGSALLGMTLGEFKQAIGDAYRLEPIAPFMADFDAIAVQQNGEAQYYILHLAGTPLTDDDRIQGLRTDNPRYQTAEGIGPGSAIATAEALYGNATLSYNVDNEGREYVRFDAFELTNLVFGTGNANVETAGIYPDSTSAYNETDDYRPDAAIESILLVCLTAGCTNAPQ